MASRTMPCFQVLRANIRILQALTRTGVPGLYQTSSIHTCTVVRSLFKNTELEEKEPFKTKSKKWDKFNTIVYPPKEDVYRPAEICHSRFNIKYSPLKMWYLAVLIRGMSIDEALKQMSFHKRKGSSVVKEVLEEAQLFAVRDHNVEYKSNLWVCDSFVGKGRVIKGVRKHRGTRYGTIHYRYCNYFVRLQEGPPPKHYYPPKQTGYEKLEEYITSQRSRRIIHSL